MSPWARVRLGAVILGVVSLSGVLGYRAAGLSWIDSVYMVVISLSTIGYTEAFTPTPALRLFTIYLIVVGLSALAYTSSGFLQLLTEGEINRVLGALRMTAGIGKLQGHVVICGFGRMGHILAAELSKQKRSFVIIDQNALRIAEALQLGYLAVHGDATEEATLTEVGLQRARTLVTVLPSDAANVFITLTARNLNRKLQIVARGEFPSTQSKLLQAGADRVVLPAAIGAQRIASMISRPYTLELIELVDGGHVMDVELDELQINPESRLIGMSVAEAEVHGKHGLLLVAIKPVGGSMVFNPEPQHVFQPGEVVIVMGRRDDTQKFRSQYGL